MEIVHDSLYRQWTEIVIDHQRKTAGATVFENPSGIGNVYGMLKRTQVNHRYNRKDKAGKALPYRMLLLFHGMFILL